MASQGFWDNHGCMDVTDAPFEPLADPRGLMSMPRFRKDCSLFSITEEISRAWRDFPVELLIWNSTLGQGLTPAGKRPVHATPQPGGCHRLCLQMRLWELSGVCASSADAGLLGVTLSSQGPCRAEMITWPGTGTCGTSPPDILLCSSVSFHGIL